MSGGVSGILDEIGALFVDVGGTLVRPRRGVGGAYAQVASEVLGAEAPPADVERAFVAAFARRREAARHAGRLAYGRTEAEARAFWREMVVEVLRPWAPASDLTAVFERLYTWFAQPEAWDVFPDALALLAAARERNLPVVAVSNWDARLTLVLRGTGLASYLHAVVASHAVGAEKPDARMFAAGLAALPEPIPPDAVLHVGDSRAEDLEGARAAGLRAVLIDRAGRHGAGPDRVTTLEALC